MFCTQCGQQNPDGSRFCARCGAALPAAGTPAPSPVDTTSTISLSAIEGALEQGEAVYGLTRRLGAGHGEAVVDQAAFQRQVLRNHRADTGDPVQATVVRAAMAARLAHLAAGGAGARPVVLSSPHGLV